MEFLYRSFSAHLDFICG